MRKKRRAIFSFLVILRSTKNNVITTKYSIISPKNNNLT